MWVGISTKIPLDCMDYCLAWQTVLPTIAMASEASSLCTARQWDRTYLCDPPLPMNKGLPNIRPVYLRQWGKKPQAIGTVNELISYCNAKYTCST